MPRTQQAMGASHQLLPLDYSAGDRNDPKENRPVLEDELSLFDMGFSVPKQLNWEVVKLPRKTSMEKALRVRFTNNISPDCKIRIGEKTYECHLIRLQVYSNYFDRLTSTDVISLPPEKVTPVAFEFILAWTLSDREDSHKLIERQLIIRLLIACQFLEIPELQRQVEELIESRMVFDEGSAYFLYMEAKAAGLDDVQLAMVPRIQKFFLPLVSSMDYLYLDVSDICNFLASDQIIVHREMDVFMCGMRWLLHDWPTRKSYVTQVLSHVRFGLISPENLSKIRLNSLCSEFQGVFSDNLEVLRMIDDGTAYAITKTWQRGEGEEFEECVEQQELTRPASRIWVANEEAVEYCRYEEFKKMLTSKQNYLKSSTESEKDSASSEKKFKFVERTLEQLGFKISKTIEWKNVSHITLKVNLYEKLKTRLRLGIKTDIQVTADSQRFPCHFILLQCYSRLCSQMKDKKNLRVPVERVSPLGFDLTYQWMLSDVESAHLPLRRSNVLEVYSTAHCLEIQELLELCSAIIFNPKLFSEGSSLVLYQKAKEFDLKRVKKTMASRIGKFFLNLVSSRDFLMLDAEDICYFLSADTICVHSEMEVFLSGVRWLRHDWPSRQKFAPQIMSCVRFDLIPPWQLVSIRRNSPEFADITGHPKIDRMISDGLVKSVAHESGDVSSRSTRSGQRNTYDLKKDYLTFDDFLCELNFLRLSFIEECRSKKQGIVQSQASLSRSSSAASMVLLPLEPRANQKSKSKEDLTTRKPVEVESAGELLHPNLAMIDREVETDSMEDFFGRNIASGLEKGYKTRKHSAVGKVYRIDNNRTHDKRMLGMFENKNKIPCDSLQNKVMKTTPRNYYQIPDEKAPSIDTPVKEHLHVKPILGSLLRGNGELVSSEHSTVLVFGGSDMALSQNGKPYDSASQKVFKYSTGVPGWIKIGDMPQPRSNHGVCVCNNQIYVIGGADPSQRASRRSQPLFSVWSLNIDHCSWIEEKPLQVARKNPGVVAVQGRIWVIGGRDFDGDPLRSVEIYDTCTQKWCEGPGLNSERYAMGICYHDNEIWVAGGIGSSRRYLNTVERLSFDEDGRPKRWILDASYLRVPRSYTTLVSAGGKMFLVAGCIETDLKVAESIGDVDEWQNGEWKLQFHLNTPRHSHAVCKTRHIVMVIGGATTKKMACLTSVEAFDVMKAKAESFESLPQPLANHAAIVLKRTKKKQPQRRF